MNSDIDLLIANFTTCLAPAIFASAVLVFSGVIDDFVLVDLLSSSAGNTPRSVIIYSTQHGGNGGPALNGLGSIMLAMSLIIVILGYRLLSRGEASSGVAALTAISGES
jgi:ABC-type spermidine/putrescine transport system permease subunit II